MDLKDLIQKDRERKRKEKFEGTFLDYLELVKEDPTTPKLSHKRIYDMISRDGYETLDPEKEVRVRNIYGEKVRVYNFFKDEFFGIEKAIEEIVKYFHAASLGGEEARQMLYLVGAVGSGKSSLVEKLKSALEEREQIYALSGCPMHEEPLHLVPRHLRGQFEEELGVKIDGDLCPVCRWRLVNEYDSQYERFPVRLVSFSKRNRIGIAAVPPVDPNNQDTSVLIGSVDISKIDKYPEDDPRVLRLNGAFNVGNRGLIEFIEIFKNEIEYLHTIITATQEKVIPAPGKQNLIYFDGVIVAHSNFAEWNKFKSELTNEALLDRIVKIEIPYCMELDQEVRIYQKYIKKSHFEAHIAPGTIRFVSMFAVCSRLKETNKVDILTKMKLYNGEDVIDKGKVKKVSVQELKRDVEGEGFSGISTRFVMKAISDAIVESEHECINPLQLRDVLIRKVRQLTIADEEKKRYLTLLTDTLHKEYLKELEREIMRAFVHAYEEQAEGLFNNYVDHIEAFCNKTKLKDPVTKEEVNPDEHFMRSIEEQIGIVGEAAKGFRQDVMAYLMSMFRKNEKVAWRSYEPLKEAVENKLMASVKDLSRIVTKAKIRDKEQQQKYNVMVAKMIESGYCEHCAESLLKYAANNLWTTE